MFKRVMLIAGALVAAILLIGSIALWLFLSSWVPTRGKARVIHALEDSGRLEATIGAMRYEPFRGFVLERVRITDRASQITWLLTPLMTIRLNWMALAQRQLAFRARSPLEIPCQTTAMVSGRYDLRRRALHLHVRTTDAPLATFSPAARSHAPAALTDATLRINLQLAQRPEEAPRIVARIDADELVWAGPAYRAIADLTVDGRATLPSSRGAPLDMDAMVTVHRGTLETRSALGAISQLQGRARVTPDRLDIERLTATALGSSWTLEGAVTSFSRPSFESVATSRVELASLLAAFPSLNAGWQSTGAADLRIGCRGAFHPTTFLDCLAEAHVQDATLTVPKIASPITRIAGDLAYDALTRRLSVEALRGRLLNETIAARGEARLAQPVILSLDVTGALPLQTLTGWLPPKTVEELRGLADVDLHLEGPAAQPHSTGRVELRQAHALLPKLSTTIDDAHGVIFANEEYLELQQLSLQWNEQPVAVTALVTPPPGPGLRWGDVPRIKATVDLPEGALMVAGRVSPEQFMLDDGRLSLERSRVHIRGTVGRSVDHPMALQFSGLMDMEELGSLSFMPLAALKTWKILGAAEVDGHVRGRWGQWSQAAFTARVQANRLSVRDLPIEDLTCQVDHDGKTLRLSMPSALIAAGKSWGQLTIDRRLPQNTYVLFEVDTVGLGLERLAQTVPAWKRRSMKGAASGHMVFSGTWQERATWRSEGWLNASGDHLGDVPLLDRFFQGGVLMPLAEWLGLDVLRRAEITQGSLHWRLAQERITTEDLRLEGLVGTAAIVIYIKGSVGLDQRVDAVVEPELSEHIIRQSRVISGASSLLTASGVIERFMKLIRYRVTGTLQEPVSRFEVATPQELLKQLFNFSPGDFFQSLKPSSP